MRPLYLIILLLLSVPLHTIAQTDSLNVRIQSSIIKADSIPALVPQSVSLPDSLQHPFLVADSIRQGFTLQASKLKSQRDSAVQFIEAPKRKLEAAIDSLSNLRVPTNKLTSKLYSINNEKAKVNSAFNDKSEALKSKTIDKLQKLDLPEQTKHQ